MKLNEEKLILAMAKNGYSMKEFCSKVPISENAFRSIRSGKAQPRPATIGRIAKALNVPVEDLIE